MDYKHECTEEHAPLFLDWIKNRGGVAVWRSRDLSDPGFSLSTPALTDDKPTVKPHWKVGGEPDAIVTDAADVCVFVPREVKRFRVALRRGAQGLNIKVTDAGTRRIRAAVARAGEGAYYVFDYDTQEAVIMVGDKQMSLARWEAQHA